jgi:hypothetical protein
MMCKLSKRSLGRARLEGWGRPSEENHFSDALFATSAHFAISPARRRRDRDHHAAPTPRSHALLPGSLSPQGDLRSVHSTALRNICWNQGARHTASSWPRA